MTSSRTTAPRVDSRHEGAHGPKPGLRRLLSVEEVCTLLTVTKKTVYGWTSRREIPFVKIGNLLRFEEHEIAKWIEARRQPIFDAAQFVDTLTVHERPGRGP